MCLADAANAGANPSAACGCEPYTWSLVAASIHAIAACVLVIVWCRSRSAAVGISFGFRNTMFAFFMLSCIGRVATFVLQAPGAVCAADNMMIRRGSRVISALGQACGFYGHWAGFTILVLFFADVRRARLHGDPLEQRKSGRAFRRWIIVSLCTVGVWTLGVSITMLLHRLDDSKCDDWTRSLDTRDPHVFIFNSLFTVFTSLLLIWYGGPLLLSACTSATPARPKLAPRSVVMLGSVAVSILGRSVRRPHEPLEHLLTLRRRFATSHAVSGLGAGFTRWGGGIGPATLSQDLLDVTQALNLYVLCTSESFKNIGHEFTIAGVGPQLWPALLEAVPTTIMLIAVGSQVVSTSFLSEGVVPWTLRVPARDIVIGAVLGEGAFGIVYQGSWSGRSVAVKRPKVDGIGKERMRELQLQLEREATLMSRLLHPNLVRFLGIMVESSGTPAIIIELMPGGSLNQLLFSSRQARGAFIPAGPLDGGDELPPNSSTLRAAGAQASSQTTTAVLPLLSWRRRLQLATDLARGVEFLHSLQVMVGVLVVGRRSRCAVLGWVGCVSYGIGYSCVRSHHFSHL